MIKVIMKRVPKKVDEKIDYAVLQRWSSAMAEMHCPKEDVRVIREREIEINPLQKCAVSETEKT